MECSSSCDPVQLLKEHRSKLSAGLAFDTIWLAGQMNSEGLLDDTNYDQITSPQAQLSKTKNEQADVMMNSLIKKVFLSPDHLEEMIVLLKKKPNKTYSDAIKLLEDICLKSTANLDVINTSATQLTDKTPASSSYRNKLLEAEESIFLEVSKEPAGIPPAKRLKLDCEKGNTSRKFCIKLENGQKIRKYQEELAAPGLHGENYIMVAPTGTGKTLVAAQIIAHHLNNNSNSAHAVFVVPTKVLADQQKYNLEKYIPDASVEICTGENQRAISQTCFYNDITVCTGGKLYTELCRNEVKFSKLSLIIFDECHSAARGSSVYANIMKLYVEQEMVEHSSQIESRLQIIGMTASPGAGKNPRIDLEISLNHLKMLAAHMNATSGIITVVEHVDELEYYQNTPKLKRLTLEPRDSSNDPFINEIVKSMLEIERDMKVLTLQGIKRWSKAYETKIRQNIRALELSDDEDFLGLIRANSELLDYCSTLCVYMNLRSEDAIKLLKEGNEPLELDITHPESRIKFADIRRSLIARLEKLEPFPNPLLKELEDVLHEKFEKDKESRGLIFVRTRYEAKAMTNWIPNCSRLRANIRPGMIVGHTSKKDTMTQAEQKAIVEKFRKGEINLLIATSVAEEGLDIPACNLVMRYQYISSDIKKKQAEGRARAVDSECYTIISSHSRQEYQDVMNEELVFLVQKIVTGDHFPSGVDLVDQIKKIQENIIAEKKRKEAIKKQRRVHDGSQIELLCKDCKVVACLGSDVRITAEDEAYPHYTVPTPDFAEKYTAKSHHTPAPLPDLTIIKTHKIYCKKCGADWGVRCVWPSRDQYPVIKCVSFTFKVEENFLKVKKWSNAPFEIQPMIEESVHY